MEALQQQERQPQQSPSTLQEDESVDVTVSGFSATHVDPTAADGSPNALHQPVAAHMPHTYESNTSYAAHPELSLLPQPHVPPTVMLGTALRPQGSHRGALFSELDSVSALAGIGYIEEEGDSNTILTDRHGTIGGRSSGGSHRRAGVVAPPVLSPPTQLAPPLTPVGQGMGSSGCASPLSLDTPAPSTRRKGGMAASNLSAFPTGRGGVLSAYATPQMPVLVPTFGGVGGGGESPLMAAPPPATPAKQRRTIHPVGATAAAASTATAQPSRAGGLAHGDGEPPMTAGVGTSAPVAAAVVGRGLRLPARIGSKYQRSEVSLKRSAEVMSQFSRLDLEESVGSPTQNSITTTGHSNSNNGGGLLATPVMFVNSFAFAPQLSPQRPPLARQQQSSGFFFPSNPLAANGAYGYNNTSNNGCATASFPPISPLLVGGYTTPTTLSQHIDLTRLGGSLSQLLVRQSQDVAGLDYSQADTECSNIFTKKILTDFREVRELGRGAFGKVALFEELATGQLVAIKVSFPLHRGADHEKIYRRERAVMAYLRASAPAGHLVQLLNAWEEGQVARIYLQLEYCPGGSVAALAEKKRAAGQLWEEPEVLVLLLHMAMALDAMHSAQIAHVDFKPDNILIDAYGNYKLSDFGCSVPLDAQGRPRKDMAALLSRNSDINNHSSNFTAAMLAEWQAQGQSPGKGGDPTHSTHPLETTQLSVASVDEGDCRYLCADMLNQKRYFKAGDMFSLGMSLFELMSGEPLPHNGDAFVQLRRQVPVQLLRVRGYSERLVRLVAELLSEEPTTRPTARQVLQAVRPPPEAVEALGSEAAMRRWTARGAERAAGRAGEEEEATTRGNEESQRRPYSDTATPAAPASARELPVPLTLLRLATAAMEASTYLLETTQRDHLQRNGLVLTGLTVSPQHHQQEQQQHPHATGHAMGHSDSYAFSPPTLMTPASGQVGMNTRGGFHTPQVGTALFPSTPAKPAMNPTGAGHGHPYANTASAAAALFALQQQQQRNDACTPTVLPGDFNWS